MANEDAFHLGVKALVTDPKGKVLLLRVNLQELQGYRGPAYWDIPGGRVHRGDTVTETLIRELREETGLSYRGTPTFIGAAVSNIRIPTQTGDVGLVLFVYQCPWGTRPNLELSCEHTEVWWAELEETCNALLVKYPKEFVDILLERLQNARPT